MSQPQPQAASKSAEQPPKPRIARVTFVHAISFAGGIESAATDTGLAAVTRLGAGIDIRPAKLLGDGSARPLKDGESYDGFLLSKTFAEGGKKRLDTVFVDRANVREVKLNAE
jgi:hypothetical protein